MAGEHKRGMPAGGLRLVLLCTLAERLLSELDIGMGGCCPTMVVGRQCSGHGACSRGCQCKCDAGFEGGDCNLRSCPMGRAWADIASAKDTAHGMAVCSRMGQCNHLQGACKCAPGFTGAACERFECPNSVAGVQCAGHGQCRSMRYHAQHRDKGDMTKGYLENFIYYDQWDSEKIFGCVCDPGYQGPGCFERECPVGDDPMTGRANDILPAAGGALANEQFNEVQGVKCRASGGAFTLSFRHETTEFIQTTDSSEVVGNKINALSTVHGASVKFDGVNPTACLRDQANTIFITFTQDFDDLPLLVPDATSLEGDVVELQVTELVKGTKESEPCANRGICDVLTAVCTCANGFETSNGLGAIGNDASNRGDCGALTLDELLACAGEIPCSAHGSCSGAPRWQCHCQDGWRGVDCTEMSCPFGEAWFDFPVADGKAHQLAECSNMGVCDRTKGECLCQVGFTGSACERLDCPVSGTDPCSGHGSCLNMQELARHATNNGVNAHLTYGEDPNNRFTWDAKKIYGCKCDEGWDGAYDCSVRSCKMGNDPRVAVSQGHEAAWEVSEKQVVHCTANWHANYTVNTFTSDVNFTLTFRDATTAPMSVNTTAAELKAELEKLPTITTVRVTVNASYFDPPAPLPAPGVQKPSWGQSGALVCSPYGHHYTIVEFLEELGDLPALVPSVTATTATTTTSVLVYTDGEAADEHGFSVRGNKVALECSGRGKCDGDSAQCKCFRGFAHSNGHNGPGPKDDCGYNIEDILPQV